MKQSRGRLSTLPMLFKYFKDDTITITLYSERITIFEDGTMKRYLRQPGRNTSRRSPL